MHLFQPGEEQAHASPRGAGMDPDHSASQIEGSCLAGQHEGDLSRGASGVDGVAGEEETRLADIGDEGVDGEVG